MQGKYSAGKNLKNNDTSQPVLIFLTTKFSICLQAYTGNDDILMQ